MVMQLSMTISLLRHLDPTLEWLVDKVTTLLPVHMLWSKKTHKHYKMHYLHVHCSAAKGAASTKLVETGARHLIHKAVCVGRSIYYHLVHLSICDTCHHGQGCASLFWTE